MEFTAEQIAALTNGKVEGNAGVCVSTFANIEDGGPGSLAFLDTERYAEYLYTSKASIVLVTNDFKPSNSLPSTLTLIRVESPRASLAILMGEYLKNLPKPAGISAQATVHESVEIGKDVYIAQGVTVGKGVKIGNGVLLHANVYIGDNTQIGANTEVKPNCTIHHDCVIGANCVFQTGVRIGGDGFGFVSASENMKIPHMGNVVIEDGVEIGANTCVDRATMGSTFIGKGVKLDNLIQVGHNVEIGEYTVIAAQTGIAGSAKIGKRCMIGGQVGIVGHITIGDDVKIAAQSGIQYSIENGGIVQGSPAFSIGDYKRSYVLFRKLPKLKAQLDELVKSKKS